jgi:short-subunit dehydrogenase
MHVAITGASSGIGAALARELANRGDPITLVAWRRPLLAPFRLGLELDERGEHEFRGVDAAGGISRRAPR